MFANFGCYIKFVKEFIHIHCEPDISVAKMKKACYNVIKNGCDGGFIMQNIKIAVNDAALPLYAVSHKNGRKTFEIQAFDGEISVLVQYDYDRRPLELNGKIEDGDSFEIVLMAHRIELYVNGVLTDEEWPAGTRLLACGDHFIANAEITL